MLRAGEVIGEKYRLAEQIGEGGAATVWRAIHVDLDRPVAIKFHRSLGNQERIAKQFLREARVAASVRHRNVVDLIDYGTLEGGRPYIVMEFLEGRSLARMYEDGDELSVREIVQIVDAVLQGLAVVHGSGIVHRDLKPENIFLVRDSDGRVYPKLLDFGISRAMAGSAPALKSAIPTVEGLIVGTPQYMSPEQARGLGDIGLRTDIYSMGVILYEAITGTLPFDAEAPGDLILQILTVSAPPVSALRSDLGQPLSDVIERAMARDKQARFKSANDMRDALRMAAEKTAEVATGWSVARARSVFPSSGRRGRSQAETQVASAIPNEPELSAPKRKMPLWVPAVALIAAFGAALGIGLGAGDGDASAPDQSDGVPVQRPVRVQLQNVPEGAVVQIDDEDVGGNLLELPRSSRTHVIEVSLEGHQTWRIAHPAEYDAIYQVELPPLPSSSVATEDLTPIEADAGAVEVIPPPRPPRPRQNPNMAMSGMAMGGLFEDPGF